MTKEDIARRLQQIRAERYVDATNAANAMGVPPPTYLSHENASRGISRDVALRYARFFGVSIEWFLTGKGQARGRGLVPVVNYVGAGAELFPVDDFPQGQGLDQVEAPAGVTDCLAARIRGESMHPLRDGWLVFFSREHEGASDELIGKLCVVKLADGRMFLKELQRGSQKGAFNLLSWNAPLITDVEIEWAARVSFIQQT